MPTKWQQKWASKLMVVVSAAVIMGGCDTTPVPPTPPIQDPTRIASWAEQLSLVQQEAAKLDKSAVVFRVSSDLDDCNRREDLTYTTEFYLGTSSGETMDVLLSDEGVARIVEVRNKSGSHIASSGDMQRFAEAIKSVQIGPREACLRTLNESKAILGERRPFALDVTMFLEFDLRADFGIPTVWEVSYVDLGQLGAQSDTRSLKFLVSPVDGSILKRLINYQEITPVPVEPSIITLTPTSKP